MFRNLEAEQARKAMTDKQVADVLGISRSLYGKKKQFGKFTLREINILLNLFDSKFEYLLEETQNTA